MVGIDDIKKMHAPAVNADEVELMTQVQGNKSDDPVYTGSDIASVIAYLKGLIDTPMLYASGTQTAVITTEHFLSSPIVMGIFTLHIDTVAMVANDVMELRVYQMILTGGTQRVVYFQSYAGVQAPDIIKVSIPIQNDLTEANALRFSLTQTFGTGRAFPWKVLRS